MQRSFDDMPSPGAHVPTPEVQRYLDLSGDMVLQLDPSQRVTLVNRHLLEVLGYEEAELLGHDWFVRCVPERDREAARTLFHRLLNGYEPNRRRIEGPVTTSSGDEKTVVWRLSVLREVDGRVVGLLAAGEDVTDRRLAESELARTTRALEAYRFALDNAAIVAITDRRGRIIHVNDRQCEISGYAREELLGRDHRILNSGYHSKEFFRNLWNTIRSGRIWRGDIRNRAKDGSMYWVATTIVPFLDDEGAVQQFVAIRNEITERKIAEAALERTVRELSLARETEAERARALEEANASLERAHAQVREEQAKLVQAEKLSSIGLLAAGVAHEINNPLFGVMACVKALQDKTLAPEKRTEYFVAAREGLVRIEQTVRGLLEFAAQRAPSPYRLAAKDVIDACTTLISPLAREREVSIRAEIPIEAQIYADRSQLMQAVMNVLLNATHASPPGAEVFVDITTQPGRVGIRVSDHGPGMPDDVLRRACDPFFSTKPEGEGTGLGLSVTASIVRAHGGDLHFDSEPGRGTQVTLWLPTEGADSSVRA